MRVTESNRQYRQKTAGMAVKGKQEIIERKIHFCSRQRKPAGAGERRQSLDLEEERRRRTVNNDDINVLQWKEERERREGTRISFVEMRKRCVKWISRRVTGEKGWKVNGRGYKGSHGENSKLLKHRDATLYWITDGLYFCQSLLFRELTWIFGFIYACLSHFCDDCNTILEN